MAFLSINPLRPGHTLVVPRVEVDHWLDLDRSTLNHLIEVAQTIGQALQSAYRPTKVAMTVVGLEVPHVHIHISPIDGLPDLDFTRVERDPDPAALEEAANRIRAELGKAS